MARGSACESYFCVVPSPRVHVGRRSTGLEPPCSSIEVKGLLSYPLLPCGEDSRLFSVPQSSAGLHGCSTTFSRAAQGAKPAPPPAGLPQYQNSRLFFIVVRASEEGGVWLRTCTPLCCSLARSVRSVRFFHAHGPFLANANDQQCARRAARRSKYSTPPDARLLSRRVWMRKVRRF